MLLVMLTAFGVMAGAWFTFGLPHLPNLPGGLRLVLQIELVLIPPVLLFALVRTALQLFTAHRLFAFYYRDQFSRLVHAGEALLYADEDYHRLLEDSR
jgi:hypothetical protein